MSNSVNSSKKVRIGVIGIGGMGARHVHNLVHEVNAAQLVALADVDAARLQQVALTYGATHIFTDAHALINHPEVDAVVIAAPDRFHAHLTQACIEVGKPVLCEKPLALTSNEARAIVDAEVKKGRRLVQVGLMREYDPAHLRVKQIIDSGALGRPLAFRGVHINGGSLSWRTVEDVITNSAVHDLHSARWMMGDEVVRVYTSHIPYSADRPDTARLVLIQLHYRGGAIGQIECNMEAGYGYEVDVKITGEIGAVETNSLQSAVVRYKNQRGQWVEQDWLQRFESAYIQEVRTWVHSLQTGAATGPSAWDGYISMLLADACIASARCRQPVEVDIPLAAEIYRRL
ncbi:MULTISPECIES: Gfo/Idh/MocA family oxidoreductase [Caldilinea]|jgi:myo-inositol 2-dehydrogenase/D-chiro-inositol 1-dehydrogenase|uniref:Gfo/Idh/MocA family oxidoreductase n=2 Tax=Caldilineaceae TaxID=475964 RepID=UPI0002FA2934|nr:MULTISPECIES: Gfo/Idh/MocA family oxidoreductase [Caldilinea]GIV67916.1 MAG: myo-inositol dehydrogenase [Caldilinea sp.]